MHKIKLKSEVLSHDFMTFWSSWHGMSRLVKYTWDRRYGNAAKLYNWTLLCASLNYEEGEHFKLTVSQNMSKYLSTEATKWLHVAKQYCPYGRPCQWTSIRCQKAGPLNMFRSVWNFHTGVSEAKGTGGVMWTEVWNTFLPLVSETV